MKMPEKIPFELVVEMHGATVFRVCRAILGPDDADDAWSETFLAALRSYAQLPADAKLEGWLVTIAHRKAIDVLRAEERKERLLDQRILLEDYATGCDVSSERSCDPGYDYDSGLNDRDGLDSNVQKAVLQLPLKQRQSITYRYLAGLSYREVAEIVGGTEAAARRAAADGIINLRNALKLAEKDAKEDSRSSLSNGKQLDSETKTKTRGKGRSKTTKLEKK